MMKDKLYKTNHKTAYYVMKKTLVSFAIFLGVGMAVGIPTTLNVLSSEPKTLKAEEGLKVETSEEETSELDQYSSEN